MLKELEEIGRGSFGVVRRGWASIGGDRVAVALKVAQSQDRSAVDDIGREVARLVSVAPHPNVVGVFGVARIGGVVRGGVAVLSIATAARWWTRCTATASVDAHSIERVKASRDRLWSRRGAFAFARHCASRHCSAQRVVEPVGGESERFRDGAIGGRRRQVD